MENHVLMTDLDQVIKELAPNGVLKIAINVGNAVLAQRCDNAEGVTGVSVALAQRLAAKLGVPYELVVYESAGSTFRDVDNDQWRVAFLANDPLRAEKLNFTDPYVLIQGTYLVPEQSPLQRVEELDQAGHRIAVGQGAVYELFLTRHIQNAELVRASTSEQAIHLFAEQGLTAAAGILEALEQFRAEHPGYRVLPGAFLEIRQCMVTHRAHSAAHRYISAFLAEVKQTDLVVSELAASGMSATLAAP